MHPWNQSAAFVTGGASGIGRALARALAARGARVCVADIDLAGAQRTAQECSGRATAVQLDVCDADAVRLAIGDFAAGAGRLDLLFNNAGIGVAGDTEELPLQAWKRVIDVNVYGVIHGVMAAYPIMLRQGFGHIVNTASLAGLGPAPLLTPYSLSKHAVVGLSRSLRIEAASRGVRVSALCPAAIETPILAPDHAVAREMGMTWVPDIRRYLTRLAGPPYPVEKCAEETLDAVARNKALIVLPARARLAWVMGRLFPNLVDGVMEKAVAEERGFRHAGGVPSAVASEDAISARGAR